MYKKRLTPLITFLMVLCLSFSVKGQQTLLVTSDGNFHQLNINNGIFTVTPLPGFCNQPVPAFSVAQYRNNVYYNTPGGDLYQVGVNSPASCKNMGIKSFGNAMTVDKNGTLYWAGNSELRRLPLGWTNSEVVGNMPFSPSGDMIFYGDKLLMAAAAGAATGGEFCLVEIDIIDPSKSKVYMTTPGYAFLGLINIPTGCNSNKVYGISSAVGGSELVELDIENKTVIGVAYKTNLNVYDASSITETGEVRGANILGLDVRQQCDQTTKGSIAVAASSATGGVSLSFSLNNTLTSNTGLFPDLEAGTYQIRVSTSDGCFKDSVATINVIDRIKVDIADIADTCGTQRGAVTFSGLTSHTGLQYSLDNAAFVAGNNFTNLTSGTHVLKVKDVNECYLDTAFQIRNIQPSMPAITLNIKEARCTGADGSVKVNFTPAMGITAISLNNVNGTTMGEFNALAAGSYQLRLVTSSCIFDSTIEVPRERVDTPVIQYTAVSPTCTDKANGSISISLTGNAQPYSFGLNNGSMGSSTNFRNLANGDHVLRVSDGNGCVFLDTLTVAPYQKLPFTTNLQTTPVTCWEPVGGKATVTITGPEAPYFYRINGRGYQSGQAAGGLSGGAYLAYISNGNNCLIDSIAVNIIEQNTPGIVCDTVYVPTGFTPNADGRNDLLMPVTSSLSNNFVFRVFNRAGQVLFETMQAGKGWDGRFKGIQQPPGVYVWVVSYTSQSGRLRTFKGTTVLIR